MRPTPLLLGLLLALSACKRPCTASSAPCTGTGTLTHGGLERTYRYHLPPGVKPGMPLVLSLHGRLSQGRAQAKLTGFDTVADEAGFLVVYPEGVEHSWADGRGATPADERAVDDVGFISALIDSFAASHQVDTRRVYATGMSNGALMSYRLACELSGRVAAIATVGGLLPEPVAVRCKPSRPVPVVSFLGAEDPLMPLEGGENLPSAYNKGSWVMLSGEETRSWWARHNGCEPQPLTALVEDRAPDDGTRVRREAHTGCREGAEVVFHVIEGGGHTWPGGTQYLSESRIGRTSRDLDASQTAWRFLQRFRLP